MKIRVDLTFPALHPVDQRLHGQRRVSARLAVVLFCFALGSGLVPVASPIDPTASGADPGVFGTLAPEYERDIHPLLRQFCLECHSQEAVEGDLDLEQYTTLAEVRREPQVWVKVVEMLTGGEMPPEDAAQPLAPQRAKLLAWAQRYLHAEALAGAGDPGPVVLRRLNNAEYTYTIGDLTQVPLDPARQFPTEGAAGEGFTNTGNALVLSPALIRKYLDAGKQVAAHAVLLPRGFRFSPHVTRRDWTDELLAEIREFYEQFCRIEPLEPHYGHAYTPMGNAGRLPLEKYLAVTLSEQDALMAGDGAVAAVAAEHGLQAPYLRLLWSQLNGGPSSILLDELRSRWRTAEPGDAPALAAWVKAWQQGVWIFNPVGLLGKKGNQTRWLEPVNPLLTEQELRLPLPAPEEGQQAEEFVVSLRAGDAGDGSRHDTVLCRLRLVAEEQPDLLLRDVPGLPADWFGHHPRGRTIDPATLCLQAPSVITFRLPAELAGRELVAEAVLDPLAGGSGSVQLELASDSLVLEPGLLASKATVKLSDINIGADTRVVSYLRPVLVSKESPAYDQFQSAIEEFRQLFPAALCYTKIVPSDESLTLTLFHREDDQLARLILDESQQAQVDKLWEELWYVSREPLRLVDVLESLLETTIDHPQEGIFESLEEPYRQRAAKFTEQLVQTESIHLDALVDFAVRAWRRPLTAPEETQLREVYDRLRGLELDHEPAFRLTLAHVFIASPFLFRLEEAPAGMQAAPVSDWELANRLSYFLWSSLPDDPLRAAARTGRLNDGPGHDEGGTDPLAPGGRGREELLQQTRRMLADPRVRRLATEFGCQWLHIHQFDPLETKSATHFPEFDGLRADMYEESIRLLTDLFQQDGSLLSLLDADHTFVNSRLAGFYGLPWDAALPVVQTPDCAPDADGTGGSSVLRTSESDWRRVEGVRQYGRGGILALATTLAKQSGATRTSPILRGNWISEVLLGEKLPRPPENVPQLADDIPDGLTERELIERHSSDPACAKCHTRIDPLGFALENYDAIGRHRTQNAAGLAIDSRTTLPDGTMVEGFSGLQDYLLEKRQDAFLRQFCRKLLGYALGREVQLSDRPLLEKMLSALAKNDYRFSTAVEMIVVSRQFRQIRGREMGKSY